MSAYFGLIPEGQPRTLPWLPTFSFLVRTLARKIIMKKSFILYCDTLAVLDHLTDEQAGQLFKAIKSYQSNQESELDPIIRVAFTSFEAHFIRDDEKYQHICERNRVNGAKGGRPKEPKEPTGLNGNPKNLDSDNDTDSDNDINLKTTSSPKVNDQIPFQKIINLYHEMLPQLPKVEKLTTTRKGYIRQRFIEDLPDLKNWENYFDYVKQSDFLMGRTQPTNGRPPFRASLEWLTKPANYAKVAEENYHGI